MEHIHSITFLPGQVWAQAWEPPVPGFGSDSGLGTIGSDPALALARRDLSPPRPR